jgi:hypothetical protein
MMVLALAVTLAMAGGAFAGDAATFEAQALKSLPLLSAKALDEAKPDPNGPQANEVWIRIKPDNSREAQAISGQVADLYRSVFDKGGSVSVVLWVGNKIVGKGQY